MYVYIYIYIYNVCEVVLDGAGQCAAVAEDLLAIYYIYIYIHTHYNNNNNNNDNIYIYICICVVYSLVYTCHILPFQPVL